MIEQVVACAKDGGQPPPELSLMWQCRRFNCLPEAGGYNDQDAATMERGAIMESVYNFERRWRAMETRDFAKLDESDRRIFLMLKNLEVKF